jgi:hypothetical protein
VDLGIPRPDLPPAVLLGPLLGSAGSSARAEVGSSWRMMQPRCGKDGAGAAPMVDCGVRLSFEHVGVEDAGAAAPGCCRWSHRREVRGGSIWHHADLLPMKVCLLLLRREVLQLDESQGEAWRTSTDRVPADCYMLRRSRCCLVPPICPDFCPITWRSSRRKPSLDLWSGPTTAALWRRSTFLEALLLSSIFRSRGVVALREKSLALVCQSGRW